MHIKPILLAILVLGVVGGVGYTVMNNKDDKKSESSQSSGSEQASEESSEKTSIKTLLSQNKNVECTFDGDDDSGNSYSGTAYIAGNRIRVDFTGTVDGKTQSGHLLNTNDYAYIWSDDTNEGFKVPAAEDEEDVDSVANSIDQDQEYNFSCSSWSVDEGKLTPPSNVNFTDFSTLLQGQTQY